MKRIGKIVILFLSAALAIMVFGACKMSAEPVSLEDFSLKAGECGFTVETLDGSSTGFSLEQYAKAVKGTAEVYYFDADSDASAKNVFEGCLAEIKSGEGAIASMQVDFTAPAYQRYSLTSASKYWCLVRGKDVTVYAKGAEGDKKYLEALMKAIDYI